MAILVRTISDQAYEVMRERILNGAMPGGSPVRQDTVADELGVSKIPLREALTRLEQDGLVSSIPNRGFVVRPMSAMEAEEVFQLRLRLEPAAAAEACLKVDHSGQDAARAAFDAMAAEAPFQGTRAIILNRMFHFSLVHHGVGMITSQFVERLEIVSERYIRMYIDPTGRDDRTNQEHKEILDAWLSRDAAKVAALVAAHMTATHEEIRAHLFATQV
jgi:DNA-binding GntR family transcriptional regulator